MKTVASPKTAAMKKAATKAVAKMKASGKAKAKASASSSKKNGAEDDDVKKDDEGNNDPKRKAATKVVAKKKASGKAKAKASPKTAASKGTVKDISKRLLEAATHVKDEAEENDDENDDENADADDDDEVDGMDGKRDRRKKQKFNSLLAQNKLPSHIVDMWTQGVKGSKNQREFKTKIINSLFSRDNKGKLVMKPEAPFFTAYEETVERKSFGVTQTGLPNGVFKGMYFQNSETALQHAIDNEEAQVVEHAGKEWYSFITLQKSHEVSKTGHQKVVTHEKKLDKESCKELDAAFERLEWDFKVKANNPSASSKPEVQAALALQDAPVGDAYFSKVESLLSDGKGALEKLTRDLLKLVPVVAGDANNGASV